MGYFQDLSGTICTMDHAQPVPPKEDIPHFGLYGESIVSKDPGFVHIEDIEARSKNIGWVIKPHRHNNMFQFLCMFDGQLELHLDEQNHSLSGSCVITVPPGVVHGYRFKPNTQGAVLTLAEPLLTEERYQRSRRYFDDLISAPHTIKFQKQSVIFDQLKEYLHLITREFQRSETGYQYMLEWLVGMVLVVLKRQFDQQRFQDSISVPSSNTLKTFRSLLDDNFRNRWKVQQYADALHISVSSLNRLCKESVGITAKSVIQNRVLIEVKRHLIYTQSPLDHIAYNLGFKDPAYFSRFFTKLEGIPPSKYREVLINKKVH